MAFCRTCKAEKPESEFYSSQPRRCKVCVRERVKANRESKADYYRAFDRARSNDPKRVEMRTKYAESENGKERLTAGKRAWQERNESKRSAHNAINNAVREGRIIKPDTCSRCGSTGRIHGHHPDYSKPLDVDWLCHRCHREEHAREYA